MAKLDDKRIKWLVVQVVECGRSPASLCGVYGVSERRVRQLVQSFRHTGRMPVFKGAGRPRTMLTEEQAEVINRVFRETRLGSTLLYVELRSRGYRIPKNKIVAHFRERGWSVPNPRKQRRRKRCRYERKYAGSLLHGDGHRTSLDHPYCMLWMDDASRKILSGLESETALTNDHSVKSMKQALKEAAMYNVIVSQVNTDRGTEFYSNQKHKNPDSKTKFEKFLISEGIKHVPSRPNNPQTNGKIERHWLEYDRHRWSFKNLGTIHQMVQPKTPRSSESGAR